MSSPGQLTIYNYGNDRLNVADILQRVFIQ
ncbi:MAG: hypothetical protein K0Q66_607, partial [Chitinophagaceae bacterium]|nr:hypothetical protein [Chitinophagaceae bacterium]